MLLVSHPGFHGPGQKCRWHEASATGDEVIYEDACETFYVGASRG